MNQPDQPIASSRSQSLIGLDGGNPLAFLAALGTLRAFTLTRPDLQPLMSWQQAGAWRPVLHLDQPLTRREVVEALDRYLASMQGHDIWSLGPDLAVTAATFRNYALRAAAIACSEVDRTWADFAAAFGCEVTTTDTGTIQDTALRTMSGAGHQHFLQFMATIIEKTGAEHLDKTLFEPWRYDDSVEKQTLRWDPADDVRRALRWRDPSGDPTRRRRGGMLGANRLAIEALPLLPTMPVGPTLRTTGFTSRRGELTFWTWPIWSVPISLDVARTILALAGLDGQNPNVYRSLDSLGIAEVFRSNRLTIGKFRGFAPAQPTIGSKPM